MALNTAFDHFLEKFAIVVSGSAYLQCPLHQFRRVRKASSEFKKGGEESREGGMGGLLFGKATLLSEGNSHAIG